jgi:hypothetical protein
MLEACTAMAVNRAHLLRGSSSGRGLAVAANSAGEAVPAPAKPPPRSGAAAALEPEPLQRGPSPETADAVRARKVCECAHVLGLPTGSLFLIRSGGGGRGGGLLSSHSQTVKFGMSVKQVDGSRRDLLQAEQKATMKQEVCSGTIGWVG